MLKSTSPTLWSSWSAASLWLRYRLVAGNLNGRLYRVAAFKNSGDATSEVQRVLKEVQRVLNSYSLRGLVDSGDADELLGDGRVDGHLGWRGGIPALSLQ